MDYVVIYKKDIISHEPAPEPKVTYNAICESGYVADGYESLEAVKNRIGTSNGLVGYFKITITGNDFTVEKVTG